MALATPLKILHVKTTYYSNQALIKRQRLFNIFLQELVPEDLAGQQGRFTKILGSRLPTRGDPYKSQAGWIFRPRVDELVDFHSREYSAHSAVIQY